MRSDTHNRLTEAYRSMRSRTNVSNHRQAVADILGRRPRNVAEAFAGAWLQEQGFVPEPGAHPLPSQIHNAGIDDQVSAIAALRQVLGYRFDDQLGEDEERVIQLLAKQEASTISAIVRWLEELYETGYSAGETMEQERSHQAEPSKTR